VEQLEEKKEFKEISLDGFSVTPRKFVFVELFAGWGGFSRAVQDVCGELVEVLTFDSTRPTWWLGHQDGSWNAAGGGYGCGSRSQQPHGLPLSEFQFSQ